MARSLNPGDSPLGRSAALFNYVEVARFLGVDPYPILKDAKISLAALDNHETRIATASAVKVFQETEIASGCEYFGLLMAECRSLSHLGPVSLMIKHQATARNIIGTFLENQRHLHGALMFSMEDDGEVALIRTDVMPHYGVRSVAEVCVAAIYRAINEIMGGRWQAKCIHFRHSPPADLAAHRRIFRCPIEFDASFDGISCSSDTLDAINPAKNPGLAEHANRFLEMLALERPRATVTDRARHAICLLVHSSNATMEGVAGNLGMQGRQLQRALESEGTTFHALLNETRRELALRYITTSGHPVSHISELLGYSSQTSFTRWFAGEFGESPLQWRNSYRREERSLRLAG